MNKLLFILYYLVVLGSNGIAYLFKIDISILWLIGPIVLLYIYLMPDIGSKKRLKKNLPPVKVRVDSRTTFLLIIPLIINFFAVLLFF